MQARKLQFFLITLCMLIWQNAFSQAPEIEWQHTIGGSNADYFGSIQQTADGGYIMGGFSSSAISGDKTEAVLGGYDYWVLKLNSYDSIEWQNTIGGNKDDYLLFIQQTDDDGYILGGSSGSAISGDKTEANLGPSYTYDYWVVKLNTTGGIEWQNTIGGGIDDFLNSIQQTADGGYILGGFSSSAISSDKTEANLGPSYTYDYWVVKLNSAGSIEWQNTIGGSDDDVLNSIQQTSDGGYILGGFSKSAISGDKTEANLGPSYTDDYWVVKLNNSGSIEWQNTIGGSDYDVLNSIQQTSDGGYILGGFSWSGISGDKTEASSGAADYWVVKVNALGTIEWENTIGGSSTDHLYFIQQTSDNGYILGGYSSSGISGDKTEASFDQYVDYWIIRLNSTGAIEWQNTIGGIGFDELHSVKQTSDGGFILGGNSGSGISGDKTEASWGQADYWVVKLYPDVTGIIDFADGNSQPTLEIYPNPFTSTTTLTFTIEEASYVTIEVFDLAGRKLHLLLNKYMGTGNHEVNLHRHQLPAGMFFVKMTTPSSVVTQSIIIQ